MSVWEKLVLCSRRGTRGESWGGVCVCGCASAKRVSVYIYDCHYFGIVKQVVFQTAHLNATAMQKEGINNILIKRNIFLFKNLK